MHPGRSNHLPDFLSRPPAWVSSVAAKLFQVMAKALRHFTVEYLRQGLDLSRTILRSGLRCLCWTLTCANATCLSSHTRTISTSIFVPIFDWRCRYVLHRRYAKPPWTLSFSPNPYALRGKVFVITSGFEHLQIFYFSAGRSVTERLRSQRHYLRGILQSWVLVYLWVRSNRSASFCWQVAAHRCAWVTCTWWSKNTTRRGVCETIDAPTDDWLKDARFQLLCTLVITSVLAFITRLIADTDLLDREFVWRFPHLLSSYLNNFALRLAIQIVNLASTFPPHCHRLLLIELDLKPG